MEAHFEPCVNQRKWLYVLQSTRDCAAFGGLQSGAGTATMQHSAHARLRSAARLGYFCCKKQAQMDGPDPSLNISTKDLACSVVQIHPPRLNWLAKPTDRCSPTEESGTFEETEGEAEIEDELSQEVQEGREIRRTYGIFR